MISLILPVFLLIFLNVYAGKNRPLLLSGYLIMLLSFGWFHYETFMNIKDMFKFYDLMLLYFLFVLLSASKSNRYLSVPANVRYAIYIFSGLFLLSFLFHINNQDIVSHIKMYRYYVWFIFPFVIGYFIRNKVEFKKFEKYLVNIAVITSVIFIIQVFTPFQFIPFATTSPVTSFMNRVYPNAILLNGMMGMFTISMYLVTKQKYYLYRYILISVAVLLTLTRSLTIGYVLGSFLIISILVFKERTKTAIRFLRNSVIVFLIVILGQMSIVDIYVDRFYTKVNEQVNEETGEIELSGRWPNFLKRWEWLENRGSYDKYFGVGLLYPNKESIFSFVNDNGVIIYDYHGVENCYLSLTLTMGLVGVVIYFFAYLKLMFCAFKNIRKNIQLEYSLAALGTFVVYLCFMMSDSFLSHWSIIIISLNIMLLLRQNIETNPNSK